RTLDLTPFFLGPGPRLFVGVDLAGPKRLQPNPSEEPAANVPSALDLVLLMVDVEAPGRVLLEDARTGPVLQYPGGAHVSVFLVVVGRLALAEIDADDVVRAL